MRVHLVPEAAREHERQYAGHRMAVITQDHASCGDCDTSYERTELTLHDVRCKHCDTKLGVSYSIISGVYCDELCYRRGNQGKRKLQDNPQA